MRRLRLKGVAGALLALAVLLAAPAVAAPGHRWYVALGDSLAIGMQPSASGADRPTPRGYADVVARRTAELRLAKLGCPGETTATLIAGGVCAYRTGSQLAQAEAFLNGHRGAVKLVTVNVGDNDLERCFHDDGSVDGSCAASGLAALRSNLPAIVARLRAAAGARVPIVGITDYDQFLALWLRGPAGRRAARASVKFVSYMNGVIDSLYRASGAIVADAAPAFATTDLRHRTPLPGHGRVPRAVANVCRLTWACGRRFDDHANAAGYVVIAGAIERALARAHRGV